MQEEQVTTQKTETKGNKLKNSLVVLVIALLVTSVALAAFLYARSRSDLIAANERISQLESGLAESLEPAPDTDTDTATSGAVDCTGGSEYSADIGKFAVALDSPRVIIRVLDAGFEGGPITSLEIGECVADAGNLVDRYPTNEVNVLAHPASSSAELKTQYEANNGALAADGTVDVSGVTAQKYKLDALFLTTVIYFDKAGIGYQIELPDTNDKTNAVLADLLSDWNFLP